MAHSEFEQLGVKLKQQLETALKSIVHSVWRVDYVDAVAFFGQTGRDVDNVPAHASGRCFNYISDVHGGGPRGPFSKGWSG